MKRTFAIAILSTTVTSALAQERAPMPHAVELERRQILDAPLSTQLREAFETRTTKEAPYSAEATTEFTHVLGDGNRIVRKSVVRLHRDSEGRMRREPISATGGAPERESITISDPMGGRSVILDPQTRTAYTSQMLRRVDVTAEPGTLRVRRSGPEGHVEEIRVAQPGFPGADAKREDLGVQTIEGVPAQGTRTTTVIPAGLIGNEQPLTIVSEQWFSPDLQVLVLTRHSDPRAGETVYRLTGIVRAEPDRTLFEVPADYTVKDATNRKIRSVRPRE